ncbi:transcriptional regulator [Salipaludibacillus keqinensis]|uniref:Transcriptional regulator n=1 Tax=Salipaludibacillus keqinensis TaxID=2045207 RepID=A0A323TEH3_9BACI|nr:FadR/GntR family transcriptional regulator [Salipaludibacillus keqinensis]PYZ93742.1 transcriptional regulator [Salipaludibacillus keqinensis]
MSEGEKAYLNILKKVKEIIDHDQLTVGDKLPSERELAERLQAGRSSVREALRALELLDLIETRKGEGTFIQQPGSHRLAEVLASFFLKDQQARQDVTETRQIIEIEAVRLGCKRATQEQLNLLRDLIHESHETWSVGELPVEEDYLFHKTLVECSHNQLMLNIWRPLVEYSKIALRESLAREGRPENSIIEHQGIYEAILNRNEERAIKKLKNHLENSRF